MATLLDLENEKKRTKSGIVRSSYLGLKDKTPKQVYQDMEATVGEEAPSYSMVKKWAGKFKLGRKSLEDNPVQEDCTMPKCCQFFHFQGLEG